LFVDLFGNVVGDSKRSLSLVSLRRDHIARLEKMHKDYLEEKERKERMEVEERERMKAMREGKAEMKKTSSVVRVVKKEKDLDADVEAAEKVKKETESKSKKVEDLGLSTRTLNALNDAKIETVSDLKKLSDEELLELKGVGQKAVDEIKSAIK
jgi:DNA-directed RNA polymerase alpha subunit